MIRLARTNRIWRAAKNAKHEDLAVANNAWLRLRRKIVRVDRLLRADNHRDSPVRAVVLRVGFRTSITPLPIHHPYFWGGDPNNGIAAIESYGVAAGLEAVAKLAHHLRVMVDNRIENPLWTAFLTLRSALQAPVVVGVRRQSAIEHLEPRFCEIAESTSLLSIGELGKLDERNATVFFGPPSVYPNWVKLFPRSNTIWIRHAWNKPLVFPDALIGVLPVAAPAGTSRRFSAHSLSAPSYDAELDDYGEPDELAAEVNRERLKWELDKAAESGDSATVKARVGVLANDDSVLLPIEDGTFVTVFDPQTRTVRREQTRRLLPGIFVVVRERGSRDHLRSLVETKFLENPQVVRVSMNRWKLALQRHIHDKGIDSVANDLSRRGVSVGHSSIKLWTTDLVHGPGSYENFVALLDYLGLSEAEGDWRLLLKVRRAGRQAGTYMRRQLIKQASEVSADQILRASTLRFTLEGVDGGALVAVQVDEILPEIIEAPVNLVGQLIEGL